MTVFFWPDQECPLFTDEVGTASLLGRRKVNEDRFSIEQISDDLLYFAIFDGHGGDTAVNFVQKFMLRHIGYWLTKTSNLSEVLQNSFIEVNNLLTRHIVTYDIGMIMLAAFDNFIIKHYEF